ncbi:MAG: ATP-binding protein [[Eubacterium] rectale]|nr:ATP-binding protein [Agathobacter rectalis]
MLVGREKELHLLHDIQNDDSSHFVAVYGRMREGKTFLIREAFGYRFTFQHAGLSEGGMKEQIYAFTSSLKDAGYEVKKQPQNWLEAFEALKDVIRLSSEKKKIIFIDELSWMDIHLRTFCLRECEAYVKAAGLALNRNQILQYYMIFGGVPYYWGFLKKGLSLSQNIDSILLEKDAPLRDEFKYLYASVFKKPENYVKIIEALGTKKVGMTREEIITATKIPNSGDLTTKLEELESCGFIRKYNAFGMKKKNAIYQLMDCFTLFYFKFLKSEPTDEHFWTNQINTPSGTKYAIYPTLITTYGVVENSYSQELQSVVTMDDLFA